MTDEKRIELMKWGCQYAEEFGPVKNDDDFSGGIMCCVYPDGSAISKRIYIESDIWKNVYYPLFLQRAIEGVNRHQTKYSIQSCSHQRMNRISIYNTISGKVEIGECCGGDIDQAKEAALIWVKENQS